MKRTFLHVVPALFFLTASVSAISVAAQQNSLPRHLDPAAVSIGKELPRGNVVSHDTRAEAIAGMSGVSKYMQPLTEWTRIETTEAVTYKIRFKVPFGWIDREQFLYLGRVSASFDVMVNGTLAAYSQTGSTPSEFDITAVSKEGVNDLEIVVYKDPVAVMLENSRTPSEPRIEGEVHILSQPLMRVRDVAVSTRMEGTSGLLELGVIMKSHRLNARNYTVFWELLSPRGETVAEGNKDVTLGMRGEDTVRFFANIPRIVPWSHEEPQLYTLFVKTQNEGRFREYLSFPVGFRSIDVQDGVVYLNRTPLPLSMRDFSPTADTSEMHRQLETLRAAGVNMLRLKGSPPDRKFYALCDRMGMYLSVRADIDTRSSGPSRKKGGNPSNDPAWEGAYLDRVMSMYHTSKNSPSVIMFSLADDSANGYNLYESYLALKVAEHDRPVIYADGGGEWNTDRLDVEAIAGLAGEGEGAGFDSDAAAGLGADYLSDGEWAAVTALNIDEGRFRIRNTRRFTPLTGQADYEIVVGRKVVSSGSMPLEVLPGEAADISIPIAGVKAGKAFTVKVRVCVERAKSGISADDDPAGEDNKVYRDLRKFLPDQYKEIIGSGEFPSEQGR